MLLDEAVVAAFYDRHRIDLSQRPYWTLPWCVDGEYATVEGTNPWQIEVCIPVADETLLVTLDGDLAVQETRCIDCEAGLS